MGSKIGVRGAIGSETGVPTTSVELGVRWEHEGARQGVPLTSVRARGEMGVRGSKRE